MDFAATLSPTHYLNSDHPEIIRLAESLRAETPRDTAIRAFYWVRDQIRYDPYTVSLQPEGYRASVVAKASAAFCIPKAILLAAAGRAVGLPTRLGFADVRNHLSSDKLTALLGTDLFAFHGYTEISIDGRWLKATPAFNRELCDRFGVKPLEFDGTKDALLQPFDAHGRRHMEYIRERGSFADFPFDEMVRVFRDTYPGVTLGDAGRSHDDEAFLS